MGGCRQTFHIFTAFARCDRYVHLNDLRPRTQVPKLVIKFPPLAVLRRMDSKDFQWNRTNVVLIADEVAGNLPREIIAAIYVKDVARTDCALADRHLKRVCLVIENPQD